MTTYSINIDYTAGTGIGDMRQTQGVDLTWKNLDQAKKALACIKEHYQALQDFMYGVNGEPSVPFDVSSIRGKSWYHGPLEGDSIYPGDFWKLSLVVQKDDGSAHAVDAFWAGYFETLHMAEVCIAAESEKENDDMRVFF